MLLATTRRLGPLLVTQALGALNDNLFKNALVVLILFRTEQDSGPALVALAGAAFILPYVLFSATAGQVADRFEKSRLIRAAKAVEVALMAAGAAGFVLGATVWLFVVLFGLGVQATFFGPLKYGILPALLPERELVAGNGLMEGGTFLGILAGTLAGSALLALPGGPWLVSGVGLALALAGLWTAAFIPPGSAAGAGPVGWNVAGETWRLLRRARAQPAVWRCILGLSWFWTLGAMVLTELPVIVRSGMGAAPEVFTLLLAFFSVGVGLGSLACARLLRGEVSARLVPWGGLGLSLFLWDFAAAAGGAAGLQSVAAVLGTPAGWRLLADLMALAVCGGVFSVPLYAVMQRRTAAGEHGRMVAANNVMNAVAIVAASGVVAVLAMEGVGPVPLLVGVGTLNLGVAGWMARVRRALD